MPRIGNFFILGISIPKIRDFLSLAILTPGFGIYLNFGIFLPGIFILMIQDFFGISWGLFIRGIAIIFSFDGIFRQKVTSAYQKKKIKNQNLAHRVDQRKMILRIKIKLKMM